MFGSKKIIKFYCKIINVLFFLRIQLNIKTNLAVFSFPNAFLNFKKQKPKKETSRST